jgi:hypothetical protein
MRCQTCQDAGKPHHLKETRVENGPSITRLVERFWDEKDRHHVHDHQPRTFIYTCSNRHSFQRTLMSRCPIRDCEWNEKPLVKGS